MDGSSGMRPDFPAADVKTGEALQHRRFQIQLTAQAQLFDDDLIAREILALEVIEQRTALRDEREKATTRMVVLLVALEVFGEVGNAVRQDRDLHFRRTGIASGLTEFLDDFLLLFRRNRHRTVPSDWRIMGRPEPGCRPARAMKAMGEPHRCGAYSRKRREREGVAGNCGFGRASYIKSEKW